MSDLTPTAELRHTVAMRLENWELQRTRRGSFLPVRVNPPDLAAFFVPREEEPIAFVVQAESDDSSDRRVARHVEIAQHFSPEADILVHDAQLGTFGLIYCITADQPVNLVAARDDIKNQVHAAFNQVTYARHLLIHHPNRANHQPLSVELVLGVEAEAAKARAAAS